MVSGDAVLACGYTSVRDQADHGKTHMRVITRRNIQKASTVYKLIAEDIV